MPNIDAETRDKSSPVWDMSQERAFIESLVNQRLSFFIVFFSIVIAGSVNAKEQSHLIAILLLGTFICWLLAITIYRAHHKWDLLMSELYSDNTHPATIINNKSKGFSVRPILGQWIPTLCSIILTLGALLCSIKVIKVPKLEQTNRIINIQQKVNEIQNKLLTQALYIDSIKNDMNNKYMMMQDSLNKIKISSK